jgi:hypothetical protein
MIVYSEKDVNGERRYIVREELDHTGGRDLFAEADRFRERLDAQFRAAAEAKARAKAEAEERQLLQRVYRGDVDAMQTWFVGLLKRERITVTWRTSWHGSRARPSARHIWVPFPRSIEDLAVAAHEVGHILVGRCPGRSPHQRRPGKTGCLCCENGAWTHARALLPDLPREAFTLQRWTLGSYVSSLADSPPAAKVRAATLQSSRHWPETRQRRLQRHLREELVSQWLKESRR